MKWQLNQLIGRCKDETPQGVTYRGISEATGLSTSTLTEIASNRASRADLNTIDALLGFFSEALGEDLSTSDLLKRIK